MNIFRKIKRNKLKKEVKNKNLSNIWRKKRIKEIGIINYLIEYNKTTKSHLTIQEL